MRRTVMVVLAAAGVVLAGCANAPQHVAGEAAPAGGASLSPSASPAVTARPAASVTPSSRPPASAGAAKAPNSPKPGSSPSSSSPMQSDPPRIDRVIGPVNVLGPTGIGKLQIGMTKTEAEATGLVEAGEGDNDCGSWYLKPDVNGDAVVGWSSRGVVTIPAFDRIATPEGVRIGSSLAQVEKAYDDLTGVAADKDGGSWGDGHALAGQEDEHAGVHYRFFFVNGAVVKLHLEHDQPRC